jgi:hypothetical protein
MNEWGWFLRIKLAGHLCAALLAFVVVLGASSKAAADIFQVVFTGTVTAGAVLDNTGHLVSLTGDSFTATFIFDSSLGTLQTVNGVHELFGGGDFSNTQTPVVSASIGFSIPGFVEGVLDWEDGPNGLIVDRATAIGGSHCSGCNISMGLANGTLGPFGTFGTFQANDQCPSINGPCGNVTIESAVMTDVSVPGPTVGAGLPGLIVGGVCLFGWWRRKRRDIAPLHMKRSWLLRTGYAALGCALLLASSGTASADIIDITFTGGVGIPIGLQNAIFNTPDGQNSLHYSALSGSSYTATLIFNSDTGSVTQMATGTEYDDVSLRPSITFPGIGTYGGFPTGSASIFIGNNGFVSVDERAGESSFIVDSMNGGTFQVQVCPGEPCGFLSVDSVTVVDESLPVPGPTVGAGASSFAFAALFLGWLVRRRALQLA